MSKALLIVGQKAPLIKRLQTILAGQSQYTVFYTSTISETFKILFYNPVHCIILCEKISSVTGRNFQKILSELIPVVPVFLLKNHAPAKKNKAAHGYTLTTPLKKKQVLSVIGGVLHDANGFSNDTSFRTRFFPSPAETDEKLLIMRTSLEIASHDTRNLFLRILSILSDMPECEYTGILNDYINELSECISEALGSMSAKKRIESLIDIINSIKIGPEKIPLPSHSRIELEYGTRRLLYVETSRLVKSALANIIENALKYSPPGTKVRISIARNKTKVIVNISDEGIGIPDQDKPFIFHRSFRSSNSQSFEGSGKGLWIAHNVISDEKGEILMNGNPNCGTQVSVILPAFHIAQSGMTVRHLGDWFKLPYEVVEKKGRIMKTILLLELPDWSHDIDSLAFANLLDHLRDERKKKKRQKYFHRLQKYIHINPQGRSVLLVDDSLYVHYTIAPLLCDNGFRIVDFAFNGLEAYNMYQIFNPKLVIMDITMPVKSGIETARDIFKKNPGARILFITALGEYKPLIENIDRLFEGKNFRVLSKPIRPQKLLTALASLFDEHPCP